MTEHKPPTPPSPPSPPSSEDQPKPKKLLPMVSVPDDAEVMAEEMQELFDEDRVTHQHGGTEPEAD
ncbi:MAG TPA: hypothetical protein VLA99_07695 [Nitrospiraceae bacterium]|nr:hypothetical protein [Nitrospiraceae bacterium]